tara:strand:+ start:706 stop:969 length:264 start_codon:yes stop_codon:yes gene_type:complete
MSKYEEFQEWLNQCPTQILDYQDNVDTCIVKLDMPLDDEAEEVEQCIVDTNGDYAECVDRMVSTMGSGVEIENVTNEWYDEEGNLIP